MHDQIVKLDALVVNDTLAERNAGCSPNDL